MKAFKVIMKIVAALIAAAGVVYVAATYGDKIVAWAMSMLKRMESCPCCCKGADDADVPAEDVPAVEEVPAEEVPVEEAPVEEAPAEEAPAEEAPAADETAVVADDADFEG